MSEQTVLTSSYMKQRMVETVVPPYNTAYTTLNEQIVQKLLTADTESDQATIQTLVNSLLRAAIHVHSELRKATKASEEIRHTVDEQVTQLILSISNQEEQVRQSQGTVDQANANIHHTQQQINLAEAAVRDSQHSLNVANNAVNEAHEAVKRARLCGMGRRKKRFLGFVRELNPVKIFRNAVGKPLCSIINSRGIDNAKERRALAEQNLHQVQQRLHNQQQNLAIQQAQYGTAQTQLNVANIQLQSIKSALNEKRAKQSLVATLTKQFKDVEVHLNNVLSSSAVLQDEMTRLIDFELVIEPLNSIYHEMLNNSIMESFDFEISAETSRQINANLKKIIEILPKMPLNEVLTTANGRDDDCSASSSSGECYSSSVTNQPQEPVSDQPESTILSDNYETETTASPNDYEAETTPLPNDYEAETTPLPNDYEAETTTLSDDYETETTTLPNGYEAETTTLPNDYEAETTTLSNDYEAETTPLSDDYETGTTTLSDDYETETTTLPNDYEAETTTLSDNYEIESTTLPNDYEAETTHLPNDYETETTTLPNDYPNDYETETTTLSDDYETETTTLPNDYEAETTTLPNGYEADTTTLSDDYETETTTLFDNYKVDMSY